MTDDEPVSHDAASSRLQEIRIMSSTRAQTHEPEPKVALALSGGGFRAALFHLGVLLYLRDSGQLSQVSRISSVSGGSVTAAYVLMHWDDFRDDAKCADVTRKLVAFAQCNVIGPIYRSFFRRTQRLRSLYGKGLFGAAKLTTLRPGGAPTLFILATNLTSGEPLAFSADGLHRGLDSPPVPVEIDVARAVAASSAFPVVFPATALSRAELGLTRQEMPAERIWATDGGVRDNSGLEFLFGAAAGSGAPEKLISVDARRCFDLSDAGERRVLGIRLFPVLERTFEIAAFQLDSYREAATAALVLRLTDTPTPPTTVAEPVRLRLRFMRTDFNRFSNAEVFALVVHGYELAARRLAGLSPQAHAPAKRDWKSTLGFETPALSIKDFKTSAHTRVATHFLWPLIALITLATAIGVVAWTQLHAVIPPPVPAPVAGVSGRASIQEAWMRAVVNDLEREAAASAGGLPRLSATAGPVVPKMLSGAIRWVPFARRLPSALLQTQFDERSRAVSALAFLKKAESVYKPLPTSFLRGRIEVALDGADEGDVVLVLFAASYWAGSDEAVDTSRVFSEWRFHAQ
ncbi:MULTISPECIES: patatin-like phospholipase family protein [unclassified Rhizobacter]|uniref:patatin-like phospholipase family protein n=1 Tax=unclassified Rhizobacter TaxID=2640088 RepID=UPI0006FE88A7|nr:MULTISPECIES: patatin-like phospholipase family protein [unclassified Rhizobacter]KQU67927.1 hypothetical protein ASC88_08185 [Rhizobacter sp. Root29]